MLAYRQTALGIVIGISTFQKPCQYNKMSAISYTHFIHLHNKYLTLSIYGM